ncbi:MAG: DNA/RNA nuclease SfsA [Caldiserica bacterium]|nr:DNA/RNA nuclease SfsA [Caldisericota bacterium]
MGVMGNAWGRFIARPNRFAVWVEVDGTRELAHLPNPGRLREILTPGRMILLRGAASGKRKTRWTAIGADLSGMLVSLDSTLPNRFFPEALAAGAIPPFRGWDIAAVEPRLCAGRADFLLARGDERLFVEVKSVTLVKEGVALFPDAPTARGRRHLRELAGAVHGGNRAAVLFVVQRPDARRFGPNADTDPAFAEAFWEALELGVRAYALVCSFDGERLHPVRFLDSPSPVSP